MKNKTLEKLITQVLGEIEVRHGTYTRLARVIANETKQPISRQTILNWENKRIPSKQFKTCVDLSIKHAKKKSEAITFDELYVTQK